MKRKALALLLCLTMIITLIPFTALADETDEPEEPAVTAEAAETELPQEEDITGDADENDATEAEPEEKITVLDEPAQLADDASGPDAVVSSFSVSAQVDGTAPWDADDTAGNDSSDSNDIVRSFDYVNYTLSYTTALTDPTNPVESGNVFVESTLPCGPDVASFNMNTLNWMNSPTVTYYLSDGTTTTEYKNGDEVDKQVLTGYRTLVNTDDNTAVPGTGTLSVGIYIGAAANGTTLKPEFTAWMEGSDDGEKVTAENVETLTVSAAQKYNIGIRQASEMNISGTYDISTGNENAARDTVSGNTSLRGRMEGYGITVMLQNDSEDKGLKGLEFPTGEITFDLTLQELSENRNGTDLSSTAGYTPVIWDYDANMRQSATGQWDRTWVYTNVANRDCAYGAAPFNKLGCHTNSTIYDSCYDGGSWYMEQDSTNPLLYHVTIRDYTIDYENYNFPTANNTWYRRTEAGTVYTANQACLSAGTVQMVLQFPSEAVSMPTYIYYSMTAGNFAVGGVPYDASATYTNTYELVPEGSIQSGVNFTDSTATSRAANGHQLGSGYMEGDAYSFLGSDVRLWGYLSTSTDAYVRTNATLVKFDADAFEINRDDAYYANGRYTHGSGEGKVNSFERYFAGRSANWESTQVMSDTLLNSTDLHYYTDLDELERDGYICVGVLYIADVENVNNSSQSQAMVGLTVKDDAALINNVYAACNDAWASYSTLEELEEKYGAPVTESGTINTSWARSGHDLYKAYCSLSVYETMKDKIESGNNGDYWYHKTEYGEDGNITGGHNVGYYGGTSLLICGEKGTVTISPDREVYDMDSGQRTAVITVTPAVTVDGSASSGTGDQGTSTTTAVVKVTLPSDLTYDTGTACWGDQAITPEVTVNDDGTSVLTFTLENVTLNETLDALTFDCTIGHAGTAQDVTNNQSIALSATIESTNDHRAKEESYGNYSTTSFNVIRLSATSISKSVDNRMIERDGSYTWTLDFYNDADKAITGTRLADVFPADGDSLSSSYSGSLAVTEIQLDLSGAEQSYTDDDNDMHFYVSSDYAGTGADLAMNGTSAGGTWTDLMSGKSDDTETRLITLDTAGQTDMNAFYFDLGTLDSKETVIVRIFVQTEGNDPGDTYNNLFYEAADGQDTAVQSNEVTTQVVQRNISGRTWIDENKNGIQDSGEPALSGVTVSLYREDGAEPAGVRPLAETRAADVYGKTVSPATTDGNGSYSFENLPAGTYRVEFTDVNGYIYQLTEANVGTDDQTDSDAVEVSDIDGDLIAEIRDINLPEIADMDRYLYESEYNDAGYSPLTIDITGTKTWDDGNDQDGLRPSGLYVYLLADGERIPDGYGNDIVAHVVPDSSGDWTFSFTGLPEYHENGEKIVYSVEEVSVTGYTTDVSTEQRQDGNYTVEITNTHRPATLDISVEKIWNDGNDQDGIRPGSITVSLLADGTAIDTVTLSEANGWASGFTDLPKYRDGGIEIQYQLSEVTVNGYSTEYSYIQSGDGYEVEITNAYTPLQTSVTVSKVWDDDGNRDGIRPDGVTVSLYANGTFTGDQLTLDDSDNWTGTFTGLAVNTPVGQPITYTVSEEKTAGYTSAVTGDSTAGFVITNTHEPETVDISGEKIWDDAGNQDGVRPGSVTVTLYADGVPAESAEVTEADDWAFSFTGLPRYRDGGTEISYQVLETAVDHYSTEYSYSDDGRYVEITNSHTPEQTSVTVAKTWDDADDQDGIRPAAVTVELLADGTETGDQLILDESDNWTGTFTGLDVNTPVGRKIVYTVKEITVDGYETEIYGDDASGFVITNTHVPETVDITGKKTWEDNQDQDGERPDSVTIFLVADQTVIETATVTAEDGWVWTFTDLPKYENGTAIQYFVVEQTVDGYSAEYAEGTYDIVNTHTPDQISVSVAKDWEDADDQDGLRPDSVTVSLYADGTDTGRTVTLSDENGWQGSFTGLDRYRDGGVEIVYTVAESGLPDGYTGSVVPVGDDGRAYTAVNVHIPEETSVTVHKFWDDADDQDGIRPASVTVRLLADGVQAGSAELSAGNNWTWTFTDLPVYSAGEEITYTVTEDGIDGYETEIDGYDVTNTHTPETVSVEGSKIWDDADDQDGFRPGTITVRLYADGVEIDSVTVGAKPANLLDRIFAFFSGNAAAETGGWSWSFTDLPKYRDGGVEIVYTVTEDPVDGYETASDGMNFTNTHVPEKTQISGSKTWDDADDQDGIRPDSITVRLYADGTEVDSRTVTEADGWTWTFTDLPKYAAGKEIVYTVAEDTVDGYETAVDGWNVTNAHTPETVDIEGAKTWDDDDDRDGIRPGGITVRLYADGEEIDSTEVNSGSWSWSFTDLPKYRDGGVQIVYTVTEDPVDGYETSVDGWDVTNTHSPERVSVPVEKAWEDDDNAYGYRPASVEVALLADGEETNLTLTLGEENGWSGAFTDLFKYENGTEIVYTVREVPDASLRYYTPKVTGDAGSGFTIVNTRNFFDIDEEIVTDETDRDSWVKRESVNEYNTIELEMSTYLPVIEPDELGNGAFTMNFHEVLDSQLDLAEADAEFSVYIAGVQIDPQYYRVTISPDDGCSFHVDVDLTALYTDGVITDEDLLGSTEIMIFFHADLEGTGLNGSYKSTVWYDVYDGDEWLYTSGEDVVEVVTYDIRILKYDATALDGDDYETAALAGATLGLYYDAAGEEPVTRNGEPYTATSGGDGYAWFYGLAEGTYYILELEAPYGYERSSQVLTVTIDGENMDGYTYEDRFANEQIPPDEPRNPEKTVNAGDGTEVRPGEELTYSISYYNYYGEAETVTIADVLDAGLDFVSASDGGTWDEEMRTVTWTIENAPGFTEGSVELTCVVNEDAERADGVSNTASVQIGHDPASDTNPVHNPLVPDDGNPDTGTPNSGTPNTGNPNTGSGGTSGTSGNNGNSGTSKTLPQTGQLNWPVWVLGGMGAAALVIGIWLVLTGKKGKREAR